RMKPEDAIRHEYISGHKASLPRVPTREFSPVKRGTHGLPGGARPLPEPPSSFRNGTTGRPREPSGASPHKSFPSAARRASAAGGPTAGSQSKHASMGMAGGPSLATSHLPRAAGRSVSLKQDQASAGATAAVARRQ